MLHRALAVDPEQAQAWGLLWQRLWHRQPRAPPPGEETPAQTQQRRANPRKAERARPLEAKASDRGLEAMRTLENPVSPSTRVMPGLDRDGAIAAGFDPIQRLSPTGGGVRAAPHRTLEPDPHRLGQKLEAQTLQGYHDVDLREPKPPKARTANLALRFGPVQRRSPARLGPDSPLQVIAL